MHGDLEPEEHHWGEGIDCWEIGEIYEDVC